MKNPILTLIIGLVIGLGVGYLLKSKTEETPVAGTNAGNGATNPSHNPYVAISQYEAQLLVNTFRDHGREDENQQVDGTGKRTRSVFIPLREIDNLSAALDAEFKKNGTTDGLRIYFARYPQYQLDGTTKYDNPYRNTVVLVSTKSTNIAPPGQTPVTIHKDYYDSESVGLIMKDITPPAGSRTPPQNRAELCPDACQGATLVCTDPTDPACTGSSISNLPKTTKSKTSK